MKSLSISRNSWLFKLAVYGGLSDAWSTTDLCRLFWRSVWGLIRAPFWGLVFGFLGAAAICHLVLYPVIEIITWFQIGVVLDPFLVFVQVLTWVAVLGVVYSFWADYKGYKNYFVAPINMTYDGVSSFFDLVKAGYRGWKSKTCVMIDVVGAGE